MPGLLVLLWQLTPASALPLLSTETMLSQPIAQRVSLFRARGRGAYADLAKAAFDREAPLKTRWRAVTTMGRLDPEYFRPTIDRALVSKDWFLRNAALIAALSTERGRAVRASVKALDDPALIVRTQAVRNLIHLKARESEPRLWSDIFAPASFSAKHQSLWVRAHLAEALASFAGRGRAKSFERLLLDDDPRLHKWAIRGLEASTGMRLSERGEPTSVARGKWLARLGLDPI